MAGFSPAYFISPKGKAVYVGTNHIAYVIRNPKKFGLESNFIKYIYDKHGERMGQEGKAREFIINHLILKKWIRIRRYGDNFWSVNVYKLEGKMKGYLQKWAEMMVKGTPDFKEEDVEIKVSIQQEFGKTISTTIGKLASGSLKENIKFVRIEELEDVEIDCELMDRMNRILGD